MLIIAELVPLRKTLRIKDPFIHCKNINSNALIYNATFDWIKSKNCDSIISYDILYCR